MSASSDDSGLLVTLEGPGAAGKSTLLNQLHNRLNDHVDVAVVQEFSNSPLGTELGRRITTDKFLESVDAPLATGVLFVADYFQQIETRIQPLLRKNDVVLKERFVDTLFACQTRQMQAGEASVKDVTDFLEAVERLTPLCPDLTVYLSVPWEERSRRMRARGETVTERDRRVYKQREKVYEERIRAQPERFIVFENTSGVEQAVAQLSTRIHELLD